jgi:DegV family protein with EDD domain
MENFAIITDSGCDLSQEMVESLKIGVAPMGLTIENKGYKHYHDFRELSKDDFYNKIRNGIIGTTSGVNIQDAYDSMCEQLKKGLDVLYLSFSSGMSSSYQSAVMAATYLRDDFPGARIEVVDTKAGSVGLGMLAYLAAQKRAEGDTIGQVVEYIRDKCQHICHYFMVDDLKYIKKTGRISHLKATVGAMLNIKPIFKLDDNGRIKDDGKIRGKNSAIKHMINRIKSKCIDPSLFFICHADVDGDAHIFKDQIQSLYPNANIIVNCVGPILGNNVGPGALAVIFCGNER